ncbi:hypothetical protein XA68_15934 [Ophiocordyceps unilateralis]|uniref:Fungal calcium binding protein domain-containing protein n=1 Tax=Ophiocordyceps unilateralis TaxID=268505 RepID=A0A2A9P7H3_OPHUN|nr:hypothetical protein XA68_15934 [Ophiocordyceps unilateralis]
MKFQSVVLLLTGASSCLANSFSLAARELQGMAKELEATPDAPNTGLLTKRAAACSLLCCHKQTFLGICAHCRALCGGRGGQNEVDDDDDENQTAQKFITTGGGKTSGYRKGPRY